MTFLQYVCERLLGPPGQHRDRWRVLLGMPVPRRHLAVIPHDAPQTGVQGPLALLRL